MPWADTDPQPAFPPIPEGPKSLALLVSWPFYSSHEDGKEEMDLHFLNEGVKRWGRGCLEIGASGLRWRNPPAVIHRVAPPHGLPLCT